MTVHSALATGLGALTLHSSLGQPLSATIPLLGQPPADPAHCLSARVTSLDDILLAAPSIGVERDARGFTLHLHSQRRVNEPAIMVAVEVGCGDSIRRRYQALLDPVDTPALATIPAVTPMTSPPATATSHHARPPQPRRSRASGEATRRRRARRSAPSFAPRRPDTRASAGVPSGTRQSVLHLDPAGTISGPIHTTLRLRLSDHLTLPAETLVPESESPAVDAAALDHRAQQLLENLEAQAASLRAETARVRAQNAAYRNALEARRDDTMSWIKGLGLLLAACLAAICWLLWRVMRMRARRNTRWHELFATQEANTIDSTLLAGGTEFGTTCFDLSELRTDQFAATDTAMPDPLSTSSRSGSPANSETMQATATAEGSEPASPPTPRTPGARRMPRPEPRSPAALRAEEISNVMELVDVWMKLNAPDKVLELLAPFNDVEQPESPLPWLCLLDVYRALGDRAKYEAILERIKQLFNVKLAPWAPSPHVDPPKSLSDFPHVIDEIVTRWQHGAALPYLKNLLRDDRDGTRHGFDLPVYRDILQLIEIASAPALSEDEELMPESVYRLLFGSRSPHDMPAAAATLPTTPARRSATRPAPQTAPVSGSEERTTEAPAGMQPEADTAQGTETAKAAVPDVDLTPMAIKLHLATAYKDIGDMEGACLLLDEVIHGGTPELSQQARQMLQELS